MREKIFTKNYFVQTELFFYTTLLKDLKGMHTNKLWRVKKRKTPLILLSEASMYT